MRTTTSPAISIALAGAILLLSACDRKPSPTEAQVAVAPVSTSSVTSRKFSRRIELAATVQPLKQVVLMAKVPGEIRKIRVAEGDRVRADQPLIELDQRDFLLGLKQAKAQLAAAGAGVEAATVGLDAMTTKQQRFQALLERDAVPRSQFEDIETGAKGSAAQLRAAEAQRQLAEVAVEAATTNLAYTVVRAPFDGVIGSRMVDPGTRVQMMPPTPLLTVVDTSSVKVEGGITEASAAFVQSGFKVLVYVDALGDQPFEGVVDRVEPIVDPRTRTAKVRIVLDNADGRLRAGMSARVVIEAGSAESASVPEDAVVRSELGNGQGYVFVVNGGQAHRREVTLGVRDGDVVEVVTGLESGETIVRGGQEKLRDGQPVAVQAGSGAR